jgi:predicted alpha/beta hydrolase
MARSNALTPETPAKAFALPVIGRSLTIPARDGYPLAATSFEPDAPAKGTVILGPAAAIPARFYGSLARHLATHGYRSLTFDYRGIGASAPPKLRGFHATLRSWAELDLGGVLDATRSARANGPVFVVAHSLSGPLLALSGRAGQLDGAYLVASQVGSITAWPQAEQALPWAFFHVIVPALTAALGYFPSSLLGSAADLPRGAALEWSRWSRHADYLMGEIPAARARFGALRFPLRVLSIEDDHLAPLAGVDRLAAWYAGSDLTRFHIAEPRYPARAIGHFGFFRPYPGQLLWPDLLAFLRAHARPASGSSG